MTHTDLIGPIPVLSFGGNRYAITFKNNSTSYRHVYFVPHKSDIFEKFEEHECMFANKFNRPLKIIRSDGGGEYISNDIARYLKYTGIIHKYSAPYTQAQNGRIDRENRTIIECARTMMIAKGVQKNLWGEAVSCAVYLLNRALPSTSNKKKTPYELWKGRKPNISKLRIFGSDTYKIDSKAIHQKVRSPIRKSNIRWL